MPQVDKKNEQSMAYTMKREWNDALERLCARVLQTHKEVGEAWPYYADPFSGIWETTSDGDWCGGQWVECLYMTGDLTKNKELINDALRRTELLRPYLERDDQFRGHRFYYSACRIYQRTGNRSMRTLALAAAYAVRSMAISCNGAMPIGCQVQVKSTDLASRCIVAVDNVHPNLRLDWWAWAETHDPTFIEGARCHLDTTEEDFIRTDGSTVEFIEYDVETGKVKREFTLLGAYDQSCWSRGQAWAIAGYLRAWEALGEPRYLANAEKLFDYWWAHSGSDGIPPWDFMDPQLLVDPSSVPIDTSAASIVCEQLARLAVQPEKAKLAHNIVERLPGMLDGLIRHLTPITEGDLRPQGMLLNGCFNQPRRFANNSELVWGTTYLLFALYYLKTGKVLL
jgi:unsaturated chondroitin disaccharide hydrolase